MSGQVRLGLIGTGRIGQVHAASIMSVEGASLSWVADPFIDGARAVAERSGAHATADATELIGSGEVDAVVIASPTPTHADLIRAAVAAGLPVLCEKPIDLDLAAVDALAPLVRESGVPVAVGFNRRFDAGFREARERMLAGEIGEMEQLSIISRDPEPPPAAYVGTSGGIFRDMSIHDLDMARFFAPDIVSVTATGACLFDAGAREHGDFDTVVITLRAASGALITITNSRHCAAGYDQRIEVAGAQGLLQVSNQPSSLVTRSGAVSVEARNPYPRFFIERYTQAYADELREFLVLVETGRSRCATFDDGRAALALADAARRSAAEGREIPLHLA